MIKFLRSLGAPSQADRNGTHTCDLGSVQPRWKRPSRAVAGGRSRGATITKVYATKVDPLRSAAPEGITLGR